MLTYMYISTVCMMAAIMMAGSCLGEYRKSQMKIDLDDTTDIIPPLTKSLNLTCSLVPATDIDVAREIADYVSILGVYIYVKKPSMSEASWAAKVSYDPDEAMLAHWLLPRATIIGFNRSEGFIKVGVSEPARTHAGDYTCRVFGFTATDTDHATELISHTVSVQYRAPESGNIAKYVHKLEEKLEEQAALLEEKDASQDTEISHIKTKNQNQDTEIYKRVSKSDIQQDSAYCRPGWGIDTVQITFRHRYSKAPRVFLSVRLIRGNAASNTDGSSTDDDTGSEYEIEPLDVTETGFTLFCNVYEFSYIRRLRVNWIAFPRS